MSEPKVTNEKLRKFCPEWTIKEKNFVRKWTIDAPEGQRKSGKQLSLCPELRGRTEGAICTKMKYWGFANPEKSRRIKSGKRMTQHEKRELLKLLKGEGRFWPSSIVASLLNLKVSQVRCFRRKRGLSIGYHKPEYLNDPTYRAWYKKREAKRSQRLVDAFKRKKEEVEKNGACHEEKKPKRSKTLTSASTRKKEQEERRRQEEIDRWRFLQRTGLLRDNVVHRRR